MFKFLSELFAMMSEAVFAVKPYIRTVRNVGEAAEAHSETFLIEAQLGNQEKRALLTKSS